MILVKQYERFATFVLGIIILVVALLTFGFRIVGQAASLGELTNMWKDLAVAGGAFVLAGAMPVRHRSGFRADVAETSAQPSKHSMEV